MRHSDEAKLSSVLSIGNSWQGQTHLLADSLGVNAIPMSLITYRVYRTSSLDSLVQFDSRS